MKDGDGWMDGRGGEQSNGYPSVFRYTQAWQYYLDLMGHTSCERALIEREVNYK